MTRHLTTFLPLCYCYGWLPLCFSGWIPVSHFFSLSSFLSLELLPSNSCLLTAIGGQMFIKANQQVRKDDCLQNMRPVMGHRNNNAKIQLVLSSLWVSNQQLNIWRHLNTVYPTMYQLMCHELTKLWAKILRHSYVLFLFINENTTMFRGKKAIKCHTASKWSKSKFALPVFLVLFFRKDRELRSSFRKPDII